MNFKNKSDEFNNILKLERDYNNDEDVYKEAISNYEKRKEIEQKTKKQYGIDYVSYKETHKKNNNLIVNAYKSIIHDLPNPDNRPKFFFGSNDTQ